MLTNLVARLGSDEFAVLVGHADATARDRRLLISGAYLTRRLHHFDPDAAAWPRLADLGGASASYGRVRDVVFPAAGCEQKLREPTDRVRMPGAGSERPGAEERAPSFAHHTPILDTLGGMELPWQIT